MQPRASDAELRVLVAGYVASVLDGSRVVGRLERLAVERHVRDLAAVEAGRRPDWFFSEPKALRALRIVEREVRHTRGEWAGQPFRFTPGCAWEAFVLWCLFGWMAEHADGAWYRRFRVAYMSMARKNAKTFLAAAIAFLMFGFDAEAEAETYFAATKRDQARIGWRQCAAMVKKSRPETRRLFRVVDSTASIRLLEDDSFCQALGRDADTMDGLGPHCAIVDELHAHADSGVWDVLRSGTGARRQPLQVGITTAGSKRSGLCWDLDHTAARVLEGLIEEDDFFAFVCRIDEGDDPLDETCWPKANPNLGVSVSLDNMRADARHARNNIAYFNEFRRKRCNEWTEAVTAWMPLAKWDACAEPDVPLSKFAGEPLVVSIDLAKWNDFAAGWALVRDGELIRAYPRVWYPQDRLAERRRETRVPVDTWAEQGHIVATAGEIIDQDAIKAWLVNMSERHPITEVCFDPAEAWKLSGELQQLGFVVTASRMGYWLSGPIKETEKLIEQRLIRHDGNPVARWMFANAAVETNSQGRIRLSKARSADSIDLDVALAMGIGRVTIGQDSITAPSFWSVSA